MGTITRRLFALGGGCALAVVVGSTAHAQLTTAVQKCIDGYNNKLRLVSQQAGKSARACIKNAGKGTEPNPDTCILANPDGKIAAKEAKVVDLYATGKCLGPEPIQQGAPTGNAAHRGAIEDLAHDLFSDPVSGVISPGKTDAKCQDKAIQRATQLFTEKVKAFRKCKKDKMKAGTVVDEATLEAQCLTPTIPDPAGKIAGKTTKLSDSVNTSCATTSIPARFPGVCSTTVGTLALGACIERQVECRVCLALNAADGTNRNCDEFDNGVADGTCGLTLHTCVLDTMPASDSQVTIHLAFLPPQSFPITGAIDIGAGGNDASCQIQAFDPINLASIGYICLTQGPPCGDGQRHCGPGPGPPLGVDWQSDGNIGACTGNAGCQTACAATCAPGATAVGQCTGYCTAGAQGVCTSDAQCTGLGQNLCNGPDPVAPAQANICQCNCINAAGHGPSDPGDMQCNISINLTVESAPPCDGTDILLNAGTNCGPISTQRATAQITDANFFAGLNIPSTVGANDQSGIPVACSTVDTSTLTGLVGVGVLNFFSAPTLNDLSVGLRATCL